jgi:hypothetical protein
MVKPRQCRGGKSGTYRTLDDAKQGLVDIRARSNREVKPIRAYYCNLGCHGWHLTSQPKQDRTRRRR